MIVSMHTLRQRFLLLLLFCSVATAMLAPFTYQNYVPNVLDFFNHLSAIIQANLAIDQGQFPLRTAPLEQQGWGYPFFQFYSPTSYLISGLIYRWFTPSSPLLAYEMTIWGGLVLGCIYMYRLAYWFVRSEAAAILASLVYVTAPYYFILITRYGAFNECIALGILPAAMFYTLRRFFSPDKDKTLLQMSLCWFLLATTHILTFMWATILIASLLMLLVFKNRSLWTNLLRTGIAYLFGIVLAAWSLGPIIFITPILYVNELTDFLVLPLKSLFSPGINLSTQVALNMLAIHPAIGLPILLGVAICLYASMHKGFLETKQPKYYLHIFLLLFLILFFLIWSPVNVWHWMPHFLRVTQYSARLLGPLMLIGALLFAWAACWLFDNTLNAKHVAVGGAFIILCSSSWFSLSGLDYVDYKDTPSAKTHELSFNNFVYLIHSLKYKKLQAIDNLMLDDILFKNKFLINRSYTLSNNLLEPGFAPRISLAGFPEKSTGDELSVWVNGKALGSKMLDKKSFEWNLSLPHLTAKNQISKNWTLEFRLKDKNHKIITGEKNGIRMSNVSLAGYLDPTVVMDVKKVNHFCKHKTETLTCELIVPPNIKLIELPMLFYPDMLKVTINGKPAAYGNILYSERVITTVSPPAGPAKIEVQFQGLLWANVLSIFGWSMWGLYFIYIVMKSGFYPKPQRLGA